MSLSYYIANDAFAIVVLVAIVIQCSRKLVVWTTTVPGVRITSSSARSDDSTSADLSTRYKASTRGSTTHSSEYRWTTNGIRKSS